MYKLKSDTSSNKLLFWTYKNAQNKYIFFNLCYKALCGFKV